MSEPRTPSTAGYRLPLLAWINGFTDPFVPIQQRIDDQAALSKMFERWPDYIALVFAGLLAGTAASLPADDPWRSLIAHKSRHWGGRDEFTGATFPSGAKFGTYHSATDLKPPMEDLEPELEPGLAALVRPLDEVGSMLVAKAASATRDQGPLLYQVPETPGDLSDLADRGIEDETLPGAGARPGSLAALVDMCSEIRHRLWVNAIADQAERDALSGYCAIEGGGPAAPQVDYAAPFIAPLQWLLHRRQTYLGYEVDQFFLHWATAWVERARRTIEEGRPLALELPNEPDTLLMGSIPPGTYTELVSEFRDWPGQ